MPAPHIDESLLDQYAMGILPARLLGGIEEHLLMCEACRDRLQDTDEFLQVFRAAASEVAPRRASIFDRLRTARHVLSVGALAAILALLWVLIPRHDPAQKVPAVVFLQALRGPEAATPIVAGKPFVLVFDLSPADSGDYQVQIANSTGTVVLAADARETAGRLSLPVQKLGRGAYWVRIYSKIRSDLLAEYGLQAE